MQQNRYVVIMAGGIGTRFWPQSREHFPKQFLDILGIGKTFIQSTYERFLTLVPEKNIYVVTGAEFTDLLKQQIPSISDTQIVAEPMRRNTGPCVAYMAHKLLNKDPNAVFVVAPSDHLITETDRFAETIEKAFDFAEQHEALLTLGITPTLPHTGYGYIQYDENKVDGDAYKVKLFTEKPNIELAQQFVESGEFLWNSGMFIGSAKELVKAFKQYAPNINDCFDEKDVYNTPNEAKFIADAYSHCISKSIDYAIMEHANNVYVIPASFGWSDLGTWLSLWELQPKDKNRNVVMGNALLYDTNNSLIVAPPNKLVVVEGLEDYCVIDTPDALIITKIEGETKFRDMHIDIKQQHKEHL